MSKSGDAAQERKTSKDEQETQGRDETLEEQSRRKEIEALARRDAAYISDEFDDFWGFGG